MSQLYVVVLAVIVVVLLAVALYRTSQVKTKADYLVAGRSLPAFVLVLTLLTSWIGAGIAVCRGGERLQKRLCRAVAAGGRMAGAAADLLHCAAGAQVRAVHAARSAGGRATTRRRACWAPFAILFAYVGITSYQFKGGGDVLHLIFPDTVTPELGTYIIAAFVIVTTALAGMSSVAYMDVAIGSLVTVICIIAAPIFSSRPAVGPACTPRCRAYSRCWAITAGPQVADRGMGSCAPWSSWCRRMLLMLGNQVMYQKFFSAKIGERCAHLGRRLDPRHHCCWKR